MTDTDTIAAVSTPPGEGAIAIVRVSGADAHRCALAHFEPHRSAAPPRPRRMTYGRLVQDGATIDEVVVCLMRARASYTGEDMVEIHCHGGIVVTRSVLQMVLRAGARAALPGEFSERAFLNGKIDLTRAEAVMDLIGAQTERAARSAAEQLHGGLGDRILAIRDSLLATLAHIEAFIDFPDEDIEPSTGEEWLVALERAAAAIRSLLDTALAGRVLREGVRTVIAGEPNAGKSSLLNRLLGFDRAIVNERPGTTRDTLEETIQVDGIPFRLTDTAGLRETNDAVEREGIRRTNESLSRADLVLHVVDASQHRRETWRPVPAERVLIVKNKSDLGEHPDWHAVDGLALSCLDPDAPARLHDALRGMTGGLLGGTDSLVAVNARHQHCLERAIEAIERTRNGIHGNHPPELVSIDLREAIDHVGDIVGRPDTEDLLGEIFRSFCIGK